MCAVLLCGVTGRGLVAATAGNDAGLSTPVERVQGSILSV